jgi:hypothetical protein
MSRVRHMGRIQEDRGTESCCLSEEIPPDRDHISQHEGVTHREGADHRETHKGSLSMYFPGFVEYISSST